MTKEQHAELKILRLNGTGYAEIASILHVPANTVKVYCYRHGIRPSSKATTAVAANTCANCSQILVPHTKRKKRFCSDACRSTWWNAHRAQLNRKAIVQRACASCGIPFNSYPTQNRRYCSHPCYISARYGGLHVDQGAV